MGLASTLSAFALGALMATLVLLNNTDGGRGAAGAPRLLEGGRASASSGDAHVVHLQGELHRASSTGGVFAVATSVVSGLRRLVETVRRGAATRTRHGKHKRHRRIRTETSASARVPTVADCCKAIQPSIQFWDRATQKPCVQTHCRRWPDRMEKGQAPDACRTVLGLGPKLPTFGPGGIARLWDAETVASAHAWFAACRRESGKISRGTGEGRPWTPIPPNCCSCQDDGTVVGGTGLTGDEARKCLIPLSLGMEQRMDEGLWTTQCAALGPPCLKQLHDGTEDSDADPNHEIPSVPAAARMRKKGDYHAKLLGDTPAAKCGPACRAAARKVWSKLHLKLSTKTMGGAGAGAGEGEGAGAAPVELRSTTGVYYDEWVVQTVTRAPDGYPRPVIAVFRKEDLAPTGIRAVGSNTYDDTVTQLRAFPGPEVRVRQGQRVEITVHNDLHDQVTSIHWHGLHMLNEGWYDGIPGLTECGIQPGASFTYRFTVTQPPGTHWWHSHKGAQFADGLQGAIVILDEPEGPRNGDGDGDGDGDGAAASTPRHVVGINARHKIHPEDDHTLMVMDWAHEEYSTLEAKYLSRLASFGAAASPFTPDYPVWPATSVLINGHGQFECRYNNKEICDAVTNFGHKWHAQSLTGEVGTAPSQRKNPDQCAVMRPPFMGDCTVLSDNDAYKLTCHAGHSLRLRLINGGAGAPLRVWVDRHKLLIVAKDGTDVVPSGPHSAVLLANGQRLDVIMKCEQQPTVWPGPFGGRQGGSFKIFAALATEYYVSGKRYNNRDVVGEKQERESHHAWFQTYRRPASYAIIEYADTPGGNRLKIPELPPLDWPKPGIWKTYGDERRLQLSSLEYRLRPLRAPLLRADDARDAGAVRLAADDREQAAVDLCSTGCEYTNRDWKHCKPVTRTANQKKARGWAWDGDAACRTKCDAPAQVGGLCTSKEEGEERKHTRIGAAAAAAAAAGDSGAAAAAAAGDSGAAAAPEAEAMASLPPARGGTKVIHVSGRGNWRQYTKENVDGRRLEWWDINGHVPLKVPAEPLLQTEELTPCVDPATGAPDLGRHDCGFGVPAIEAESGRLSKDLPFIQPLELDEWYDIVLVNYEYQQHPFHLHGHTMFITGRGTLVHRADLAASACISRATCKSSCEINAKHGVPTGNTWIESETGDKGEEEGRCEVPADASDNELKCVFRGGVCTGDAFDAASCATHLGVGTGNAWAGPSLDGVLPARCGRHVVTAAECLVAADGSGAPTGNAFSRVETGNEWVDKDQSDWGWRVGLHGGACDGAGPKGDGPGQCNDFLSPGEWLGSESEDRTAAAGATSFDYSKAAPVFGIPDAADAVPWDALLTVGDTITVPGKSFVTFRIHANNPGAWLMHCHMEFHLSVGMGWIFNTQKTVRGKGGEGEKTRRRYSWVDPETGRRHGIKQVSDDFPVCGRAATAGSIVAALRQQQEAARQ